MELKFDAGPSRLGLDRSDHLRLLAGMFENGIRRLGLKMRMDLFSGVFLPIEWYCRP